METIEEKARAYDEAIKKAKSLYKASEPMSGCSVILETLFPELAESEDEKIRKWLLDFVQGLPNEGLAFHCYKPTKEQVIVWLEKQAERKTPQWMIDFLDSYRRKIGCCLDHDEARDVEGKILCIMQWLENQDEQEKDILEDAVLDGNEDGLIAETIRYKKEKQGEKKHTNWSEEDEINVYNIIHFLEEPSMLENNEPCKKIVIDWLKSIKGRVQPKQEWSEDDKRKIDRIYSILRQAADTYAFSTSCRLIGDKECMELQDFLKSLRPQNHWKPSEEQMKQLHKYCPDNRPLTQLYQDLKKLEEV